MKRPWVSSASHVGAGKFLADFLQSCSTRREALDQALVHRLILSIPLAAV